MAIHIVESSAVNTGTSYSTDIVTSKDGTTIGYHQFGHGPGLVIVHGTMSSAYNHKQLAEILADDFTVYVIDRRGRGLSGAFGENYSIQKEVEDLEAVLTKTNAHNVFGVSSGGIISLEATLNLPMIHNVAVFEPPLSLTCSEATALLTQFDDEIAQGKTASALVTAMKGAQMGPHGMPRWFLMFMTKMMLAYEARNGTGEYVPMATLAPTLHYDFHIVQAMSEKTERFSAIHDEVLLLGGSKSPAYLKLALDDLEQVLPHATRIEFTGLDHGASWNTDKRGNPEPVARALRTFFA